MINRVLIVKISSLGDIVQSFPVLDEIKEYLPDCKIDWVVKKSYEKLIKSHPLIDSVIAFDFANFFSFSRNLRRKKYDILFDLQGNTKSALVTLLSNAKEKVGFGKKTVREFPNLFATTHKYDVSKKINIQSYYLSLIKQHFKLDGYLQKNNLSLLITAKDRKKILKLDNYKPSFFKIMIATGSAWKNKELDPAILYSFLKKLKSQLKVVLYFVYGTDQEKQICIDLKNKLNDNCIVLEKMEIPLWQNAMTKMDLVFTVDTAALHLAATTNTITFSVFGPTSSKVFKPIGSHYSMQGSCPYNVKFVKQCPRLRKCPTGACIKKISAEALWEKFQSCLEALKKKNNS